MRAPLANLHWINERSQLHGVTLLDRLETKKVVESDRTDQAFTYRPIVSVRDVQQKRVESLVDKLYQGEPGLLVLHLLKSHPLDPRQAKEVRALLEEMNAQAASSAKPKKSGSDSSVDVAR